MKNAARDEGLVFFRDAVLGLEHAVGFGGDFPAKVFEVCGHRD
jgi:hypothetical protein